MVNRISPKSAPGAMKTYSIVRPVETHTRPASCGEVDCVAQAGGWETVVDETSDLGQRQAHYIRAQSGRAHTERHTPTGTVFVFPPGQQCFAEHRVDLERPELYVVRPGDWRQYGQGRQHTGPDSWLNDFGGHLDNLNRTIEGKV